MKNKEIEESIKRIKGIVDFYKLNDENNYDYSDDVLISMKNLLSYIEQLEKENDRLKEVVENLTTMTVNGDTKQIKNTAQYKLEQLEKRNKELYEGFMATQEELTEYATKNEQLENLCNKYEQEHKTTFETWKKDIEKLKQLQNNRDKAFEYIESHFIFDDKTGECYQTHTFDKDNVKELYDILKGDSDYE